MESLEAIVLHADQHSDIGMEHLPIYQDIFKNAITAAQGPILEIGTNRGGSALMWLETLRLLGDRREVITVDPYGRKPYSKGAIDSAFHEYGNDIYVAMKTLLAPYPEHTHYRLISEDFLSKLHRSEFWVEGSNHELGGFAFAFLDGDHRPDWVLRDYLDLGRWMARGGTVLIDNVNWDGQRLGEALAHLGEVVASGARYAAIRRP